MIIAQPKPCLAPAPARVQPPTPPIFPRRPSLVACAHVGMRSSCRRVRSSARKKLTFSAGRSAIAAQSRSSAAISTGFCRWVEVDAVQRNVSRMTRSHRLSFQAFSDQSVSIRLFISCVRWSCHSSRAPFLFSHPLRVATEKSQLWFSKGEKKKKRLRVVTRPPATYLQARRKWSAHMSKGTRQHEVSTRLPNSAINRSANQMQSREDECRHRCPSQPCRNSARFSWAIEELLLYRGSSSSSSRRADATLEDQHLHSLFPSACYWLRAT